MAIRCASSAHLFCRDVGWLLRNNLLNGEECKFVQGRLCKLALGPTYGSVVHHLWLRYSPRVAAQFLSDAQRMVLRFLLWYGFSVRFTAHVRCSNRGVYQPFYSGTVGKKEFMWPHKRVAIAVVNIGLHDDEDSPSLGT